MESEFVSVRGAVLIYGDESARRSSAFDLRQRPDCALVSAVPGSGGKGRKFQVWLWEGGREGGCDLVGQTGMVMRGQLTFMSTYRHLGMGSS